MTSESVSDLLDSLAYLREQVEAVKRQMDTAIKDLIPTDIQGQIEDVKAELEPEISAIEAKAKIVEDRVRELTVEIGATVKGATLQAVFVSASRKVDMKKFDGYVAAHPEAVQLVETGKPSVQIRKV